MQTAMLAVIIALGSAVAFAQDRPHSLSADVLEAPLDPGVAKTLDPSKTLTFGAVAA